MQYKSSVGKLIIAFAISLLMLSSVALAGVPSKLPLQCYSSKQVTTYNSANGSRWGYISANVDLIQITQISGEWAYGSYPTSRGRISRWFRLSDIVPNLSFGNYDTGMYRASTAYRTEGGSSTIGSVYANDTVTVVYRGNNRSQVIYPVSGGYKLGWVNNNDIKPLSQPTPSSPNLYNLTAAYPMDGVYTLTPGCATNMNLSIYNDGTANKAQAVIYNAGHRNSSKWKIQRIGNSEWYYIIDVNSGKSLDNEAGRGANGNMISLWPEQGVCQRWRFWQVRNGVYVIQAYTNDQFVLDVAGADTRANTIVQLWPYNASPAQQWMLTKTQQSVTRPATNNTSNTVSTTTYYVNTNSLNLNLRQSPSSSASIVAKMPRGAVVTGYDAGNGWGRVTYNGITGYASMQYLSTGKPTIPTNSNVNPVVNNSFVYPLAGNNYKITTLFYYNGYKGSMNYKHSVWLNRNSGGHFNALDIGCPDGTRVKAVAAGKVIYHSTSHVILIQHDNGMQSLYAHLRRKYVSVGDRVSAGQEIGEASDVGIGGGNYHLHLEFSDRSPWEYYRDKVPFKYCSSTLNAYNNRCTSADKQRFYEAINWIKSYSNTGGFIY